MQYNVKINHNFYSIEYSIENNLSYVKDGLYYDEMAIRLIKL